MNFFNFSLIFIFLFFICNHNYSFIVITIENNKVIILDQEIIQIAQGTDLANPNAQIQFYGEMKKKGLTKLLENAGVKRGDKVWLEDIEMEMG